MKILSETSSNKQSICRCQFHQKQAEAGRAFADGKFCDKQVQTDTSFADV
jgi:hypothetical protein